MIEEALEALREKPLLIYGWSPDGLIASIIALKYRGSVDEVPIEATTTWKPGHPQLEQLAIHSREAKSLVLLGTGWSGVEIDLLAPMVLAPVVVIDNSWSHRLPRRPNVLFLNPSPRGDPRANWPTTASLVSSITGNPHPFLAASSIVSLMGDMARGNRVYQSLMSLSGLDHNRDYQIASECAMQAYGITSMSQPTVHSEVARSLVEADPDPCKAMLKDVLLTTYRAEAEAALDSVYKSLETVEENSIRVAVAEGEGRHYLALARVMAMEAPEKVNLLVYRDSLSRERIGCAWSINLGKPLARASSLLRAKGYEVYGYYQGPANFVCYRGSKGEGRFIEDLRESLGRLGYVG